MRRAWFLDFCLAFARGAGAVVVILFAGGPVWAAGAFFYLLYITAPTPKQNARLLLGKR